MQVSKQMTAGDRMQIVIHALDFGLTAALRDHCERRCRYALTAYREQVQRVVVRLSSGSRTEKCCQVQVVMDGLAADATAASPEYNTLMVHEPEQINGE